MVKCSGVLQCRDGLSNKMSNIIRRRMDNMNFLLIWPPRSPDLTSPDFFLCSYLKDTVYRSNPRDLKQLKWNFTRAIAEVNERTLRKVARNMVKRVEKCIEMNGRHFQHLL